MTEDTQKDSNETTTEVVAGTSNVLDSLSWDRQWAVEQSIKIYTQPAFVGQANLDNILKTAEIFYSFAKVPAKPSDDTSESSD